jgi:hypothetical protein
VSLVICLPLCANRWRSKLKQSECHMQCGARTNLFIYIRTYSAPCTYIWNAHACMRKETETAIKSIPPIIFPFFHLIDSVPVNIRKFTPPLAGWCSSQTINVKGSTTRHKSRHHTCTHTHTHTHTHVASNGRFHMKALVNMHIWMRIVLFFGSRFYMTYESSKVGSCVISGQDMNVYEQDGIHMRVNGSYGPIWPKPSLRCQSDKVHAWTRNRHTHTHISHI